ncbi:MAG: MFS transporter, partial [Alphaproteobacteria bacterium]
MTEASRGSPWLLFAAVTVMLLQQGLIYLATLIFPIAVPALATELGISTAYAGLYTALVFLASSAGQLSCGGLITRFGALRVSQVALLVVGSGLAAAASGEIWMLALSAVLLGTGNSVSTPASSHLLARFSPRRYAPLIFSVKQTGTPLGAVVAGAAVPVLILDWGWRSPFVVFAGVCL